MTSDSDDDWIITSNITNPPTSIESYKSRTTRQLTSSGSPFTVIPATTQRIHHPRKPVDFLGEKEEEQEVQVELHGKEEEIEEEIEEVSPTQWHTFSRRHRQPISDTVNPSSKITTFAATSPSNSITRFSRSPTPRYSRTPGFSPPQSPKASKKHNRKSSSPPPPSKIPSTPVRKKHVEEMEEEYDSITFPTSPAQFVDLLVDTYKNSDQLIAAKNTGNTPYLFQPLADCLSHCDDPCTWIQSVLVALAEYFTRHKHTRDINPKFQRLLVQGICRGLELFLELTLNHTTVTKQCVSEQPISSSQQRQQKQQQRQPENETVPDLIVFTDDDSEVIEGDLIDLSLDDENDILSMDKAPTSKVQNMPLTMKPATINTSISQLDPFFVSDNGSSDTQTSSSKTIVSNSDDDDEEKEEEEEDDDDDDDDGIDSDDEDDLAGTIIIEAETLEEPTERTKSVQQQQKQTYTFRKAHQLSFIDIIATISAPSVIYYAIDTFRVTHFLMSGGSHEKEGTSLCRQLLRSGFYSEAVSCIHKLHQYGNFPMGQLAEFMFDKGQSATLQIYVKDKPVLQYSLLSFINIQLRYNFAGQLGVVNQELLKDVEKDSARSPPIQRMRERRFQKDLVTCGSKVVEQLGLSDVCESKYYFIWLSQRYASLRWVLSARSAQQAGENDYSIDGSSNYNGLVELIAEESDSLMKLTVKELVDIGDMTGAYYFATKFQQESFFGFYQSLLPIQRKLGVIKGEQTSHSQSSYHSKKRSINGNDITLYYQLPFGVQYVVVDDEPGLIEMKYGLSRCRICGLDSEWVPSYAKAGNVKTALVQIATNENMVYLLDLKAMLKPSNRHLLKKTEHILRLTFESKSCTKLAYEFGGDLSLLEASLPGVKEWKIHNFKDMKKLRHYVNNKLGNLISGGLAGVVSTFLGVSMNKKQQLSNWEKRPLTNEQMIYAACDAYCLLDVYQVLERQGHPFLAEAPNPIANASIATASLLDSPIPSNLAVSPPVPLLKTSVLDTPSSTHSADSSASATIDFIGL